MRNNLSKARINVGPSISHPKKYVDAKNRNTFTSRIEEGRKEITFSIQQIQSYQSRQIRRNLIFINVCPKGRK